MRTVILVHVAVVMVVEWTVEIKPWEERWEKTKVEGMKEMKAVKVKLGVMVSVVEEVVDC